MARLCQPAMNIVNTDLEFTVEWEEDFEQQKLPTLVFKIRQQENRQLNDSCFQKLTKMS